MPRPTSCALALADEVATALSWTPSLAVRPMAASKRFVGRSISPQQAGQQLRVEEVVTGHFSAHQSELRVTRRSGRSRRQPPALA